MMTRRRRTLLNLLPIVLWFVAVLLLPLVVPPSGDGRAPERASACKPWGQAVYPKQPSLWGLGC
jgi:hypothetical protein